MPTTRSSKRRASTAPLLCEPAVKKTKRSSPDLKNAEPKGQGSRLLNLPVELLDMILALVAAESGAFLGRKSTALSSPSGLLRVSRFVRHKYQSVLNVSASPIRTQVLDLNFSHITRFLKQLSERELHTLQTLALPTERKFVIKLLPTKTVKPRTLQSWLLRLEDLTRVGTKIQAEYTVDKIEMPWLYLRMKTPTTGWEYFWLGRNFPVLGTLNNWLPKLDDGRFRDEVIRIKAAITDSYVVGTAP